MKSKKGLSEFTGVVAIILLIIIGIGLFSSFTIIDAGHRGVIISASSGVKDEILDEGFHMKTPLIERVKEIEVRTVKIEKETGSTSADQQLVQVIVALNYHPAPDQVNKLYQEIGNDYESRIVLPALENGIKSVMGQYKAEDLIIKRDEVGFKTKEFLVERLATQHIIVDSVNIIEIDFSETYNNAVELKVEAQQNVEKEKNILEKEKIQAEIKVVQAEANKKQAILEAEGRAEATLIEAQAQAQAIDKINNAIASNDRYLTYQWISQWSGITPQIVSDGSGFIVDLTGEIKTSE